MKIKILFTILLFNQIAFSQKDLELGLGVLSVDIYQQPELIFYTDTISLLMAEKCKVEKIEGEFIFVQTEEELKWLEPESFWMDYSILDFRVVQKFGEWFEVYVHNTNEIKLWIKRDEKMTYQVWIDFFKEEVSNLTKIDHIEVEIKSLPSDSSNRIGMMDSNHCFEIIEVKGDWLKIKSHTILECDSSVHPITSGWIRWQKNNRLLIAYGQVC